MKCPIDDTQLAITERQGVEIDYCPQCRGVWLDRGELDKVIDKSAAYQAPSAPPAETRYQTPPKEHYDDRQHDNRRQDDRYYKKKKRESFLGDLFDF
jgi:Zn-finger nucleic acid-binding protein